MNWRKRKSQAHEIIWNNKMKFLQLKLEIIWKIQHNILFDNQIIK